MRSVIVQHEGSLRLQRMALEETHDQLRRTLRGDPAPILATLKFLC
jgi:hypothetical protein